MKSNNTINLTTEDILENPYNYTLKDMIQVIGEKEATAFFHKLYCEKPKKEYATIKIKIQRIFLFKMNVGKTQTFQLKRKSFSHKMWQILFT